MIGFPYPKYLNAIMDVDQSAGVLIASVGKARELGVPEDRCVFLHGCADAADLWYPLERQNYYSSPAIRLTGQQALDMAGVGLGDIDFIDLYSCFPGRGRDRGRGAGPRASTIRAASPSPAACPTPAGRATTTPCIRSRR